MPRSHPLPERESAVCRRVREYRESLRLSRVAFADELRIETAILKRVEMGRVPLKAGIAYQLFRRFPVNPDWLANGNAPQSMAMTLPSLELMETSYNDLFSSLYDRRLCEHVQSQISSVIDARQRLQQSTASYQEFEESVAGRVQACISFANDVQTWVSLLPDSELNRFMRALKDSGQRLLHRSSFAIVDVGQAMDMADNMDRIRYELAARRLLHEVPGAAHYAQVPAEPENKSLTNLHQKVKESGVCSPLQSLLGRIQRATKDRGSKVALASALKVKPSQLSEWLHGRKEPGGEATLNLLHWVQDYEHNKTKNPSGVVAPPGRKTRSKKSTQHESLESNP